MVQSRQDEGQLVLRLRQLRPQDCQEGRASLLLLRQTLQRFPSPQVSCDTSNFSSYGFCYADNRYDSFLSKVKLNVNLTHDLSEKDGTYEELLPHMASREDMICAEEIRMKFDALNLSKPLLCYQFS